MTTENQVQQRTPSAIEKLKATLAVPSVSEQLKNCMAENSSLFVASLIDLYSSDTTLQQCDPNKVIMEALKAATLKLPINKGLGFAWIIPYKKNKKVGKDWVSEMLPQFQLGYRGYIQLAMRTGQYRYINADMVYEGENKGGDKLTGHIDLTGQKTSDVVVGYFAHIETLNGFKKTAFMTKAEMEAHAKKYSKSYGSDSSPWKTDFDAMGKKTMLRALLGKYGVLSVEMATAFNSDFDERAASERLDEEMRGLANAGDIIDVLPQNGKKDETQEEGPGY